jgi:hypothetical protein
MAAYLQWVCPRYTQLREQMGRRARELRAIAQEHERHRRTASQVAELQAGFEVLLCFAVEASAISNTRAEELRSECWSALTAAAESQGSHHQASEPTELFLRLLRSAVGSGSAHIACPMGQAPEKPEAFGWRFAGTFGKGDDEHPVHHAQGARVGWVAGSDLYLDLDAALRAAQEMAGDTDRIGITVTTLAKRLHERGHLVSTEGDRGHLSVRRSLEGVPRRTVYHLHVHALTGAAQSAPSAQDESQAGQEPNADARGAAGGPDVLPRSEPVPEGANVAAGSGGAVARDAATESPSRCRMCGGSRHWRLRSDTPWVCGRCHAPSKGAASVEWNEPEGSSGEAGPDA